MSYFLKKQLRRGSAKDSATVQEYCSFMVRSTGLDPPFPIYRLR